MDTDCPAISFMAARRSLRSHHTHTTQTRESPFAKAGIIVDCAINVSADLGEITILQICIVGSTWID